jgi:hypothetical protein
LVSGSLAGSIYEQGGPVSNLFTTFCVESIITLRPGVQYWASVDPKAYSGNKIGGDAVSDVSEWIYDKWLAGNPNTWTQFDISRAMWWAEEESDGVKNDVAKAALSALAYPLDTTHDNLRLSQHTWAMNLWDGFDDATGRWEAHDRQSQLVTVPVPAAVLLGLLGLGAAGLRLRKFA